MTIKRVNLPMGAASIFGAAILFSGPVMAACKPGTNCPPPAAPAPRPPARPAAPPARPVMTTPTRPVAPPPRPVMTTPSAPRPPINNSAPVNPGNRYGGPPTTPRPPLNNPAPGGRYGGPPMNGQPPRTSGAPVGPGGRPSGPPGMAPGRPGPGGPGRPGGNVARAPTHFVGGARPMFSTTRRFSYRGRTFSAVRAPRYFYPRGYGYRRFTTYDRFPAFLIVSDYFIPNYYLFNLAPPPPNFVWVRFGPDAILVNSYDGTIMDTAPGVFDESSPPPDDGGYQDPNGPPPQQPNGGAQPMVDADGNAYPGPDGYPAPPADPRAIR